MNAVRIGQLGLGTVGGGTLELLARNMGCSKERVRQIETNAIRKLRNSLTGQGFKAYLS